MRLDGPGPMRGSIRSRMMVFNVATLALILGLFGALTQYTVRTGLLDSIDQDLAAKARLVGGPQRPPRGPHGPPPPEGEPGFAGPPGDAWFEGDPLRPPEDRERPPAPSTRLEDIYRPRTVMLGGGPPGRPRELPWDAASLSRAAAGQDVYSTVVLNGEPVRILSVPLRHHAEIVGVLQVPYPLTYTYQAIARLNQILLLLVPLALALAAIAGAALTDRALRPVRHIASAAERIDAEELSRRLP
ncbi:MAG: hypothetical protein JO157_09525, partial [Acetobacteraceae bacterium]|nr:hypothetical protein [Acetobacteraceae bacterium]